jgi:hypothetical protein
MQNICDVLELDYNELKDKLPKPENDGLYEAQEALDGIELDGGDVIG